MRGSFVLFAATLTVAAYLPAYGQRPSLRREPARQSVEKTDFRLERFSPQGSIVPGDAIMAAFSADVISESDFAAGRFPEKVFSFDPALEGREEWDSPREVRFVPVRGIRKSTEYSVRINPQLKSAAGKTLAKSEEYKFNTWPLHLTGANQRGFTSGRRALIELQFSDAVKPSDLRKYLKLSVGGKPLKWKPQGETASATPRVETDPLSTKSVTVKVMPGLTGASGPLALRSPMEKLVEVKFDFSVEELKPEWHRHKPSLHIRFSSDVNLENFRKFVSVTPPIEFQLGGSGNEVSLIGDFKPESRYEVALKQGLEGQQGELMADVKLSAWIPAMPAYLEFMDGGGVLSTRGTMKLHVQSSLVTTLTVTAHKLFDNNVSHYLAGYGEEYELKRLGREVGKKVITVDSAANRSDHTEINLQEILGEKPAGLYALSADGAVAENAPDKTAWDYESQFPNDSMQLNLSNLGITAKHGSKEVAVWVTALDSAEPVADAEVSVFSTGNQLVAEGKTNAEGTVVLKGLAHDGALKPAIAVVKSGEDMAGLDMRRTLSNLMQFDNSGPDFLQEGYEAFLTTERGAYRPGERVRLSGFIRDRNGAPPPGGFPLELEVVRPDGRELPAQIVQPTAEGSIVTDFAPSPDAPTGYYKARVQLPGTTDEEASDE